MKHYSLFFPWFHYIHLSSCSKPWCHVKLHALISLKTPRQHSFALATLPGFIPPFSPIQQRRSSMHLLSSGLNTAMLLFTEYQWRVLTSFSVCKTSHPHKTMGIDHTYTPRVTPAPCSPGFYLSAWSRPHLLHLTSYSYTHLQAFLQYISWHLLSCPLTSALRRKGFKGFKISSFG